MNLHCLYFFLFLNLALSGFSVYSTELNQEKDFIVFSIPKCGSGLINKFFELSSSKRKLGPRKWFYNYTKAKCTTSSFDVEKHINSKIVNQILAYAKNKNLYLFSHTNFSRPFLRYLENHNRLKCVLQIRDLRDACISLVYWKDDVIKEVLGQEATFNEKLSFVLSGASSVYKDQVFNLKGCALRAVEMMQNKNVIVSRFEDLVGEKGGGEDDKQLALIFELAAALSLQKTSAELEHIATILWGNEEGPYKTTFRKGQINKWKEIFTPEHKRICKKYLGKLLIQMGYENDYDW